MIFVIFRTFAYFTAAITKDGNTKLKKKIKKKLNK